MSHSGPADVREFEAVAAAVQDCADRWGPIDIVVSGSAGNFLASDAARNVSGALILSDGDQAVGAGAIQL